MNVSLCSRYILIIIARLCTFDAVLFYIIGTTYNKAQIHRDFETRTVCISVIISPFHFWYLGFSMKQPTLLNPLKVFFVTRLPKEGWLLPLPIFLLSKRPIVMLLVLEDRYEPLLSVDTNNVPVDHHWTSQWLTLDGQKTGCNWVSLKKGPSFDFLPKILIKWDFDGFLANYEKKWLLYFLD